MSPDRLSREPFANLVARAILAAPDEPGMVFAVCGGWGTGKTWTARRIVDIVSEEADLVWFEPWMVRGAEALAQEFFVELGKVIGGSSVESSAQTRRGLYWRYAAHVLSVTGSIAGPLATLGVPIAGVVKTMADGLKPSAQTAADALKELSQVASLHDAKVALSEDLVGLEKPLVVVIDDIDRLDEEEVRMLFRLIKACADFPRVRYLLLYDRGQVVSALDTAYKDGEAFLDKIVRSPFDLPEITSDHRKDLLTKRLLALVEDEVKGEAFERLSSLFHLVLLPGLPTPRLINRFLTTAADLLAGLRHSDGLDVDVVDWLALEYLRQREPGVYEFLRRQDAPRLGGFWGRFFNRDKEKEALRAEFQASLPADEARSYLAREAVGLIGGFGAKDDPSSVFDGSEWDAQNKRFKSHLWRRNYFGFEAGRAALSTTDFNALRLALDTSEGTMAWLSRFQDIDRRGQIAAMLGVRVSELNSPQLVRLLTELLRWGETRAFDGRQGNFGWDSWPSVVGSLGERILVELGRRGEAADAFREATAATNSVVGAIAILKHEGLSQAGTKAYPGTWCSPEQLSDLKADYLATIRNVVNSGRIWDHPSPRDVYKAFLDLSKAEAIEWYQEMETDPKQAADFINKIVTTYIEVDVGTGVFPKLDDSRLNLLRSVPEDLLSAHGKEALRLWIEADEQRRKWEAFYD